jgi:exopolysaccharide biosynthesis WecB/TagA/CpsF family protein
MLESAADDLLNLLDHLRIVRESDDESLLISEIAETSRPLIISFLNQHGFNLAASSPAFLHQLERADLLLRDGVGLEIALALVDRTAGRNMNGTDFIPKVIARMKDRGVALFGTRVPWLEVAASRLEQEGSRVVARLDGFQPQSTYVATSRERQPGLIILGMGMPQQEAVAEDIRQSADWPVVIVNGGAILDFLGGRFFRAPRWVRQARLEWIVRMAQEPSRLAPRYVSGGVDFLKRAYSLRTASRSRKA